MIKVEGLKKLYGGTTVLNIPELQIPNKQCFGLVGNNGAGKTTFFRTILDLIRPTEGRVLINRKNVRETEEWKNYVGSYLDEHQLLSYLTPDEYFEALRKIYNMSDEDLQQHLQKFEVFFNDEIVGKKKYIRSLSKGNIKKVGIAAAMMGHPDIVLLDEPFENLDPSSQSRLKKFIIAEIQENQTTFLISSHDLTHVTEVCNRIVLLEKGLILQDLHKDKEDMAAALHGYFED
ncbi:MAG TPA: ATP-binding cassette domain-containing protein [Balneolaceae bacterium]|nr:ATP-binding cassette domain-containing protein [Balneolaceae bacterium]